jgi:diguanylate cyclase (GGDEF)-like protein/PAS domain S-box-containing protein
MNASLVLDKSNLLQKINLGNIAAGGLAAVLLILPGLALWAALVTYFAGQGAKHATEVSDAFTQARYVIGAEEAAEGRYRIAPGPHTRAVHQTAADSLIAWLEKARQLNPQLDGKLVADALSKHATYLEATRHMFAAIDAGSLAEADEIDRTIADPAFSMVENIIVQAAAIRQAEATHYLGDLADVQRRVLIAAPIVLIFGMVLVVFFWLILRTYRRQALQAVLREMASSRQSERRFRSLVQNATDVILICTGTGKITYYTPAAQTDWGYEGSALLNQPLLTLVQQEDQFAFAEAWRQALVLPGIDRRTELRLRDATNGARHTEMILTNLLHEPGVDGIVATIRDISSRKEFEQQLTQKAFYDGLTRLPNRALFLERLGQAIERAARHQSLVGLLFIDLDNFKLINDSLGHHLGDVLLTEVAARLQACARRTDTVARLSGDEFVILMPYIRGEADATQMADHIEQQFASGVLLNGREIVISASIGVAIARGGSTEAEELLRNADLAMYRAKTRGKGGHVTFESSMHTDALARLELESDLHQAITRGELRVQYQPIVLLQSGGVVEAEALVRWDHPTRGLVRPDEFIPIAEETGLIVPLGRWVLEQACHQASQWQARHPDQPALTIGVNLSPRQFQQADLVEQVTQALRMSGLAPSALKLEITESVAMANAERTIVTLQRLKTLGVQIAIDDFGTGYSSLAYLKRLPLDVLKIDRSFVAGIGTNQEDNAIVQAIIALAHTLDLSITAEGIETKQQALLLRSWGCERGQGFHWSRPVDATAFGALLEERPSIVTRSVEVA